MYDEKTKRVAALQYRHVQALHEQVAELRAQLAEQRAAYAQVELEREQLQEQLDLHEAPPRAVEIPTTPVTLDLRNKELLPALARLIAIELNAIKGRVPEEKACEHCGRVFVILPPETRKTRKYCSDSCRGAAYRSMESPEPENEGARDADRKV